MADQKDFYLRRLDVQAKYYQTKADKNDVAQQPQASGQQVAKPHGGPNGSPLAGPRDPQPRPRRATEVKDLDDPEGIARLAARGDHVKQKDIEDFEILCNDCFLLIRLVESWTCTGSADGCQVAERARNDPDAALHRPPATGNTPIADINFQLLKLRGALESRLQDASPHLVNVMRHLTHLRVHIDTALRWSKGSQEVGGGLSDHTVQQVKQLTTTSRVLAPAVYIFSKRIENLVVMKEHALLKLLRKEKKTLQYEPPARRSHPLNDSVRDVELTATSVVTVVSEVNNERQEDTACELRTEVSQEQGEVDVANVQEANEIISLSSEDEQRRWFFALCLKAKMACKAVSLKRKMLMSDLYLKVKADKIPIENWDAWIRGQLVPQEATAPAGEALSTSAADAVAPGGVAGMPTQPIGGCGGIAASLEKSELEDTSMVPAPVPPGPSSDDASTATPGGYSLASPPTHSDAGDRDSNSLPGRRHVKIPPSALRRG